MTSWKDIIHILKKEGIAVIPTDTIYGILGSALSKKAVERIYSVRGRDKDKPCIVLISSFTDLKKFGVTLSTEQEKFLKNVWPGKVSVIVPVTSPAWKYLHRGTKSIAFRMVGPRNKNLYNILKAVGPLVAPSANLQGQAPALTKREARKYFGNTVDAYICGGTRISKPSTLVDFTGDSIKILREGAVKIKKQ